MDTNNLCHSSEGEKLRDKVELPVVHFGISATYCCLIKRCLILGRKIMTNLDSILKIRDITLSTKVFSCQGYGFLSSHVWMGELEY